MQHYNFKINFPWAWIFTTTIIVAIWMASRILFFSSSIVTYPTPKKEAVRISPNFLPLIFASKKVTTHPGGNVTHCDILIKNLLKCQLSWRIHRSFPYFSQKPIHNHILVLCYVFCYWLDYKHVFVGFLYCNP